MSTTLRITTLRVLKALGYKHFRATSSLGQPYIVHLGDSLGEAPYYNPTVHRDELIVMAAWCNQIEHPLIFDIGGNVGFIATHLAQMVRAQTPEIFSFEPVPITFQRLFTSVRELGLQASIHPVCAALSDQPGLLRMSFSEWDTMYAQVVVGNTPNQRIGDRVTWTNSLTLEQVVEAIGRVPDFIKIDVEGHECSVFRGGHAVLTGPTAPAVFFEVNPTALQEAGEGVPQLAETLHGYEFYYAGDFEQHKVKFGAPVPDLARVEHACNIFAIPPTDAARARWQHTLKATAAQL